MNRMRVWLCATTLAVSSLAVSCGPKNTASDQSLATDIQAKLYADATTKGSALNVAVKDGVVNLSGDVPNSDVELQAMKIANGTAGVRSVNDQMKVNTALASTQVPSAPPPSSSSGANSSMSQPASPPPSATAPQAPPAAVAAPPAESSAGRPPEPSPSEPPPAPPQPVFATIPAGDRLAVRMIDSIDTKVNTAGQTFRASLDSPLIANGRVIVPAGTPVTVLLENSKGAGRIKGSSELSVRATSLQYGGRTYDINSSVYEEQGKARGKQTAIRTGIGAAAGALIGGLAGGGKGAAIGSAAGGGAGFGINAFTHGSQVKIPSETVVTFRLEAPLRVERQRHSGNSERR